MIDYKFPMEIRNVIMDALPQGMAVSGEIPDQKYTFIPMGHSKALHPDAVLVSGIRGSGKSFWWSVLQSNEHRQMVAHLLPKSNIFENTIVSVGFGVGEPHSSGNYPDKDTLVQLISQKLDPRHIWRTIVFQQVIMNTLKLPPTYPASKWADKIKWVIAQPEEVQQLLFTADQILDRKGIHHLILFDALDRTADDWPTMQKLIRGLLQVLLEFRSYRRIRPKAFVRPDHIEDKETTSFPDSSKLLAQKVELRWPRTELYGLLWQYLGNEPENGGLFRDGCKEILSLNWKMFGDVWTMPNDMRIDEEAQKKVFHSITGSWMGKDHRRGFPYSWLPNHLGDSSGQVSPRSFLSAIRQTAEDKPRLYYEYALYYESIKRGVQKASSIRVLEMQEDYPWVDIVMKPLSGLTVPCQFGEIARRWKEKNTLERLKNAISSATIKLPPVHLNEGDDGIRQDIEDLGVFQRMLDDRVNLPDVYRVGYGLGRRGGIKKVARDARE
ncbi:MAG: hypothetical protein HQK95_06760 [Nitrospirae bacterium]|nr:hypothetical protein [Nitrospirota bacterium]